MITFVIYYLSIHICTKYQVEKLNDERNWRKGLRVRTVLRRSVCLILELHFLSLIEFVICICTHSVTMHACLWFCIAAQVSDEAEASRLRPLCGLRRRLAALLPDVIRLPDSRLLFTCSCCRGGGGSRSRSRPAAASGGSEWGQQAERVGSRTRHDEAAHHGAAEPPVGSRGHGRPLRPVQPPHLVVVLPEAVPVQPRQQAAGVCCCLCLLPEVPLQPQASASSSPGPQDARRHARLHHGPGQAGGGGSSRPSDSCSCPCLVSPLTFSLPPISFFVLCLSVWLMHQFCVSSSLQIQAVELSFFFY